MYSEPPFQFYSILHLNVDEILSTKLYPATFLVVDFNIQVKMVFTATCCWF